MKHIGALYCAQDPELFDDHWFMSIVNKIDSCEYRFF